VSEPQVVEHCCVVSTESTGDALGHQLIMYAGFTHTTGPVTWLSRCWRVRWCGTDRMRHKVQ
jgi:hypothetical protein